MLVSSLSSTPVVLLLVLVSRLPACFHFLLDLQFYFQLVVLHACLSAAKLVGKPNYYHARHVACLGQVSALKLLRRLARIWLTELVGAFADAAVLLTHSTTLALPFRGLTPTC